MAPLFLYPALSGRGGGSGDTGPNFVFRNGDRLKLKHEPNTTLGVNDFFGQFTNPCYRIPAMVITNTGRIIVASDYRSKPSDQVAIIPCIAYSDDNGKTWTKKVIYDQETWFHNNPYFRIMDSTMWVDKEGAIHILSGYWQGTGNNTNWTEHRNDRTWNVVKFVSRDNGNNWTMVLSYRDKISGLPAGSSWLGGVGNCVTTKQGTYIVPIQFSPAANRVSMTFMYSQDGENWTLFPGSVENCSETSVSQWVNSSGATELMFISRRDGVGVPNNKKATYVIQNANGQFAKNTFTDYGIYDSKIPARTKGCQGSQICSSDMTGNLTPRINVMVSYAKNFFDGINAYTRDHIVVGGFPQSNIQDPNSRKLKELETISLAPGATYDGTPYGGYSMMYYNHTARKMGIAYENMLGICYKDLSHLIPQFLMEPAE